MRHDSRLFRNSLNKEISPRVYCSVSSGGVSSSLQKLSQFLYIVGNRISLPATLAKFLPSNDMLTNPLELRLFIENILEICVITNYLILAKKVIARVKVGQVSLPQHRQSEQ